VPLNRLETLPPTAHFDGPNMDGLLSLDPLDVPLEKNRHRGPPLTASDDCLNVLLLGATGVGKSTFINAFINYLTFDTLNNALNGEMQNLIYSTFSTSTEDDEETEIVVGVPDDREGTSNGNRGGSDTQSCRAYTISNGDRTVRLIDTPGIGDTRGFDQDVKNMKDVISYISNYMVLSGVCILLKPNEERLTPSLRYCIVELLAHLHKDVANNITFCFTNARSTMFHAGATLNILKALLGEFQQTSPIELSKDTIYYFDSEAFRFLACVKNGIKFSNNEQQIYDSSWRQSTTESIRLINHIRSLSPHLIEKTVSLNKVRDMLTRIEMLLPSMSSVIEMEQTVNAAALFANFLAQHSIVVYHLGIEEYLEDQIKKTRTLPGAKHYRKQTIESLESSRESYSHQVSMYKKRCRAGNKSGVINVDDIRNMLHQLYALKENGKMLKEMMDEVVEGHRNVANQEEVSYIVQIRPQRRTSDNTGRVFSGYGTY
jgi:GTPase SAR1 family protein